MILLLLLAVVLAAIIGANSSANCVGPAIGGRAVSYWKGIGITTVFAVIGMVLEGPKMANSVGGGILTQVTLPPSFVILALFAAIIAAIDQPQQRPHIPQRKTQLAAAAHECQPLYVIRVVDPVPAGAARWFGQDADPLVITDGLDIYAAPRRQFADCNRGHPEIP